MIRLIELLYVIRSDNACIALRRILLDNLFQLFNNNVANLCLGFYDFLQLSYLVFKRFGLLRAFEYVLLVDVTQADIRDELGLNLIDAEAFHQVRDNIRVLFGLADDFNRLVNIQQNLAQTKQQM